MAYAISDANGFTATEKFRADTDYARISMCYRMLDAQVVGRHVS